MKEHALKEQRNLLKVLVYSNYDDSKNEPSLYP